MTTIKSSEIPRNFDWPHGEPGRMRESMAGQRFVTVFDGENLPDGGRSKVLILMTPGKVSSVHLHKEAQVDIDVIEAGPQGVLTLAGDELEIAVWTSRYQSLTLPRKVPHVAIYPLPDPDSNLSNDPGPDLLAIESRTNEVADADIVELPGFGPLLVQRLGEHGLLHRVTPSAAMLGHEGGSLRLPTPRRS